MSETDGVPGIPDFWDWLDEQTTVTCERHGETRIVRETTSKGFAGGTIWWTDLACGCQECDDSDDVRAAR